MAGYAEVYVLANRRRTTAAPAIHHAPSEDGDIGQCALCHLKGVELSRDPEGRMVCIDCRKDL